MPEAAFEGLDIESWDCRRAHAEAMHECSQGQSFAVTGLAVQNNTSLIVTIISAYMSCHEGMEHV